MKNYLLDCELQEKIWEKLIQLRACALLINEVTNPHSDNRNDNVNTCSWMIADELNIILEQLENLPAEGESKNDE
ncbi:hypothetical protein [uncultured Gilliamella sp.]|uniref:hypothetical protein n=1 Tax=uncultured Gilliamella sp. TaxID=1193505 RepID=UPI0025DD3BE8|nr:hypothetical protein [uncultured Gilliamella sp.]